MSGIFVQRLATDRRENIYIEAAANEYDQQIY